MELSAIALWLNTAFSGYDYGILGALHTAAEYAGSVLTPVMKLITLLGEKGLLMFLLALVLVCFPRTRKMGVCVFGAVCCGALITNIILKDLVARPRPFETLDVYRQWWTAVGAPAEDDFSFPSGHVTAITAGMTALCLTCRRRNRGLLVSGTVVAVLLMAISRNYLVAHYPSDVLFAAVIGLLSAFIAYVITLLIFRLLEDHDDLPLCADLLDFDVRWIPDLIRTSRYKGRAAKPAAEPEPKPKSEKPAGKSKLKLPTVKGGYQGKH
ncbi:MAG: phosphatase PAP2 family protein [Oscillospiraceae bacterium]|nr:phosphatase PAP2 family protein [Oscillospiraceae bacterium]